MKKNRRKTATASSSSSSSSMMVVVSSFHFEFERMKQHRTNGVRAIAEKRTNEEEYTPPIIGDFSRDDVRDDNHQYRSSRSYAAKTPS